MNALIDIALLVGGAALLYFGAEWLVAGAAGLGRSLGLSQLLIGLTVVAYATSAPEIVVSVGAAFSGHPDVALGNVLGSNIANLGLILGLTAVLRPTPVARGIARSQVPMLLATAFAVPLLLLDGRVSRWEGGLLVLVAIGYTAWMIVQSRRDPHVEEHAAIMSDAAADAALAGGAIEARSRRSLRARLAALALLGLAGLVLGGHLFVEGALGVARTLGMSERLVGLTVVAIGTSLPELATSLIAAMRGHSDIAVGNVVGSNVFNVLLCLGCAALAGSIVAPLSTAATGLGAMIAMTLLGAVMMRSQRTISRTEGGVLLLANVAALALMAWTQ